jgi:uncharacterized cupin superfamily protein
LDVGDNSRGKARLGQGRGGPGLRAAGAKDYMASKVEKIKGAVEKVARQNGHQLGMWQATDGSWRITCYLCGHSAIVNENFGYSVELTFRCVAVVQPFSLNTT